MLLCNDKNALTLDSSVRSMRSDCEDDEVISKSENVISDKKVIEWAKVCISFMELYTWTSI